MSRWQVCLAAVAFSALATPCSASVFELFGAGPRSLATVGAGTASADGGEAAFHNPAMLMASPLAGAWFGMSATKMALRIDLQRPACTDAFAACSARYPSGFSSRHPVLPTDSGAFEMGWNYPVGGVLRNRLAFGASLALPVGHLIRIAGPDPQAPNFIQYEGMPDRLAFLVAIAGRITDRWWFGMGTQVLAVLNAQIDLQLDATNRDYQRATIDIGLQPRARLTAGTALHPRDDLWFGLAWRQHLSLQYGIPANVAIGSPAELSIGLGHDTLYSPDSVSLGAAWRSPLGGLRLTADLAWARWSAMPDPSPSVTLDVKGDGVRAFGLGSALDVGTDTPAVALHFRDTFSPALAVEARVTEAFVVRGGYRYRPTPAPRAEGPFKYLDNDAHVLGAGVSYRFGTFAPRLLKQLDDAGASERDTPGPLHIDLGVQAQVLPLRTVYPSDPNDPVGAFSHGGSVWHAGVAFGGSF